MTFRIIGFLLFPVICCLHWGSPAPAMAAPDFDPPFPRIGQVTFYPAGSGPEIWKGHDLVIIRHYFPDDARRIRQRNPRVILLAANDALEGTAIEDRTGLEMPEAWFVHYADGSRVPFWGGYVANLTDECPVGEYLYGPQRFNQFLARFLAENTDWSLFDGTFFDTWYSSLEWYVEDMEKVDLDNDGKADGSSLARARWEEGKRSLIENLRSLVDKPILAHEAGESYLNGNGFEFWTQETSASRAWNLETALRLLEQAVAPRFNYANSEAEGTGAIFRGDFTSAQIAGAFFGHDEGTFAHRWSFLHDEYEADLGRTTSDPQQLEPGLWVRYFENGVVISNLSGEAMAVDSSRLEGGPYWRFRGNQMPQFNNGEPFDRIEFEPVDGIMLFKRPTTLVTPIVIDNVEKNATSLGQRPAEYRGAWVQSKSGAGAYGLGYGWDDFGYVHAYTPPGDGENSATYRPSIGLAGRYEVFEWHGRLGDPPGAVPVATNVPYTIRYAGGQSVSGVIDQTGSCGRWNSLGVFPFEKGDEGFVRITNRADGYVISDAVRFVWRGDGPEDCEGDLDRNERVDVMDLQEMVAILLEDAVSDPCADLNADGNTDILDLQALVSRILGI